MSSAREDTSGQPTVRSVERALDLLELLERSDRPMRLVDLGRGTGLSSATLLRLLGVLQRRDLVTAVAGEYRLGVATLGMAHGYISTDPLSNRARPHLQQLADTTKLTTSLYVRSGDERILAVRVDGAEPFRYQLPLGRRLTLHLGAGKPILANLPAAETARILDALGETQRADGRTVSVEGLDADLATVRRNGFHVSVAERDTAVASLSVPVFAPTGEVIASLSASGPIESTDPERLPDWAPELRRAAAAVGR
ncbi:IclR family transcriptional regulator [Microbacterium sp. PRF11]|uniref:IclR family transcriptional regulator n=1 Tax=Microbacterium sp. PRF11 TaxID=2962593 RepID=UPI002881BAF7|nr:IclR family transcriptional regulator [Microbacterium sp. PRF11]MDT0116163.1 IclR family transcriptional regulator [Microbacterium sp. PRF11]